jgi:hypothetical protein
MALTILLPAFLFVCSTHVRASDGPQPPCGGEPPSPPYADIGAPPNAMTWSGDDVRNDGWQPPPCSRWATSDSASLVALGARFPYHGDVDGLLERYGAVSELASVRYWSVSDGEWRDLVDEVGAVTITTGGHEPRGDFSAAEMRAERDLHFYQDDTRPTGGAVYRIRVQEIGPDRLVVAVENVTAIELLMMTLFPPGALQSVYFLDRLSPDEDIWGYYSLTRIGRSGASSLLGGHEASYLNRAVALFRHVAGIPTDAEPPLAP